MISFLRAKLPFLILSFVMLIAIFLRFWQIRDYVVFLGDEGRDMIVMRDIFVNKHLPFLGPTASVGGFYLGPIYYWMAAPFLFLWRYDPVGPAYFVAIIGVATVYLLYRFLKETVGFGPAILASLLYATAPLIVRYSRSSWNPNPLPFFSLLTIYTVYLGIKQKKYLFFVGAGACVGIAVQLHYLSLILVPIAAIIILINTSYKIWLKSAFFAASGFVVTFSPFLVFEIRHNFPNFRTILEFLTRGSTLGYQKLNLLWLITNSGNIFFEQLSGIKANILTKVSVWAILLSTLLGLFKSFKDKEKLLIFSIGFVWFAGGLLTLRLYTGQIYDYYFGSLFSAPFLLAGLVYFLIWEKKLFRILATVVTLAVVITFLKKEFYVSPPNRIIDQTKEIADFVIQKSSGKQFNFGLISDHNSDHAYRYFLDLKGHSPTDLETLITDQLIVVCESKNCEPLGNPSWGIVGFGRAEIDYQLELKNYAGIKVFHLKHWPGAPSPAGKPAVKGGL